MDLYQQIARLCDERGIRPGRMCLELGISRGIITDLKMGRKHTLSAETLEKIAAYFGITLDELYRGGSAIPTPDSDTVMILARKRKNLTPEQVRQVIGMTKVLFGDDFWDDVEDAEEPNGR